MIHAVASIMRQWDDKTPTTGHAFEIHPVSGDYVLD
jgi:hypothetical protein